MRCFSFAGIPLLLSKYWWEGVKQLAKIGINEARVRDILKENDVEDEKITKALSQIIEENNQAIESKLGSETTEKRIADYG